MTRNYTAWTQTLVVTQEQIEAEAQCNQQRAVAEQFAKQSVLRYEQIYQGRHDGSELLMRIDTRNSGLRRCA